MSKYCVKIKQSPGWDKNDTGMISISQGQEAHEGAKLEALLDWGVTNHKFCLLNISDTLHRHNLIRNGMDADSAATAAYRLGNEWMQRNAAALDKYRHRFYRIHRWNDWLHHPEFNIVHDAVQSYFIHNPGFRQAAMADIESFTTRKGAQAENTSPEARFNSTRDYLLEETAAYIIMSRTYAANRAYPAKPLQTFEYLRQTPGLPPLLRGMERAMCVRVLLKRLDGVANANDRHDEAVA